MYRTPGPGTTANTRLAKRNAKNDEDNGMKSAKGKSPQPACRTSIANIRQRYTKPKEHWIEIITAFRPIRGLTWGLMEIAINFDRSPVTHIAQGSWLPILRFHSFRVNA